MDHSRVSLFWDQPGAVGGFATAACLHGHTMHSEECLSFLPRYLAGIPGISQIVRCYQRGPRPAVDFSRAYWTPPLTPASAMRVERTQIENLGLRPLVSLTDHDNIDAGLALKDEPISVEWTVPYERSVLHLGIHNLPVDSARSWISVMAAYTSAAVESRLPEILGEMGRIPGVLIALNHPFWLEEGVEETDHRRALDRVLRECNHLFHAFELNGTRRWSENRAVVDLAREWSRPVVSGDRHACEPAACLNLTNATSFAEFAGEVRSGHSVVLFMPHYRDSMPVRMWEAIWDILRPYPEYPGRERWTDRLFYRGEDGTATPLSILWKNRMPWVVRPAAGMLEFPAINGVRLALRRLLSRQAEVLT
jgi:hypothetical protein